MVGGSYMVRKILIFCFAFLLLIDLVNAIEMNFTFPYQDVEDSYSVVSTLSAGSFNQKYQYWVKIFNNNDTDLINYSIPLNLTRDDLSSGGIFRALDSFDDVEIYWLNFTNFSYQKVSFYRDMYSYGNWAFYWVKIPYLEKGRVGNLKVVFNNQTPATYSGEVFERPKFYNSSSYVIQNSNYTTITQDTTKLALNLYPTTYPTYSKAEIYVNFSWNESFPLNVSFVRFIPYVEIQASSSTNITYGNFTFFFWNGIDWEFLYKVNLSYPYNNPFFTAWTDWINFSIPQNLDKLMLKIVSETLCSVSQCNSYLYFWMPPSPYWYIEPSPYNPYNYTRNLTSEKWTWGGSQNVNGVCSYPRNDFDENWSTYSVCYNEGVQEVTYPHINFTPNIYKILMCAHLGSITRIYCKNSQNWLELWNETFADCLSMDNSENYRLYYLNFPQNCTQPYKIRFLYINGFGLAEERLQLGSRENLTYFFETPIERNFTTNNDIEVDKVISWRDFYYKSKGEVLDSNYTLYGFFNLTYNDTPATNCLVNGGEGILEGNTTCKKEILFLKGSIPPDLIINLTSKPVVWQKPPSSCPMGFANYPEGYCKRVTKLTTKDIYEYYFFVDVLQNEATRYNITFNIPITFFENWNFKQNLNVLVNSKTSGYGFTTDEFGGYFIVRVNSTFGNSSLSFGTNDYYISYEVPVQTQGGGGGGGVFEIIGEKDFEIFPTFFNLLSYEGAEEKHTIAIKNFKPFGFPVNVKINCVGDDESCKWVELSNTSFDLKEGTISVPYITYLTMRIKLPTTLLKNSYEFDLQFTSPDTIKTIKVKITISSWIKLLKEFYNILFGWTFATARAITPDTSMQNNIAFSLQIISFFIVFQILYLLFKP
jgi:hypothetical protein